MYVIAFKIDEMMHGNLANINLQPGTLLLPMTARFRTALEGFSKDTRTEGVAGSFHP